MQGITLRRATCALMSAGSRFSSLNFLLAPASSARTEDTVRQGLLGLRPGLQQVRLKVLFPKSTGRDPGVKG